MTKFGQAEYNDFMARIFADKLDKLLKESEKHNYINRNTEDIYKEFVLSFRYSSQTRSPLWRSTAGRGA